MIIMNMICCFYSFRVLKSLQFLSGQQPEGPRMFLSDSSSFDNLQAEIDDVKKEINKTNEEIRILQHEIQELRKQGDETERRLWLDILSKQMEMRNKLMESKNILLRHEQQGSFSPCSLVSLSRLNGFFHQTEYRGRWNLYQVSCFHLFLRIKKYSKSNHFIIAAGVWLMIKQTSSCTVGMHSRSSLNLCRRKSLIEEFSVGFLVRRE